MTQQRSRQVETIRRRFDSRVSEIADFGSTTDRVLVEAFGQVVQDLLRIEDEGWLPISDALRNESVKGMSLDNAKAVTRYMEKQTKSMGGLLGRGLRLKNNHAFGRGYEIKSTKGDEIKTWIRNIIEDEDNWETLFSPTALKELNRILFTSGNLFVSYDTREKTFERLAIDVNIDNALTDPRDKSRLRYVLTAHRIVNDLTGESKVEREWVPTLAHRNNLRKKKVQLPDRLPGGPQEGVDPVAVSKDRIIIEKRINKDNGDTWGVPDGFGAAPWAVMYSSYLRDAAKLQNALAAISYMVKAKTEVAARAAGAKLSQGRVGAAAVGGPDLDIQQVPRAGAVDMYEGRPLQAQAASNMDVSVTGLASDPGLGGSYASENALSQPEQLAALSRQEDFVDLFRQIFSAMGAADVEIDFRRLDVDPIHRTMQSLKMARADGGINQEEYRNRTTELLDIDRTTDDMPEPDEFIWAKKAILPEFMDEDQDPGGGDSDQSAAPDGAGLMDDDGNSARNDDAAAGTA